MKPCCQSGGAEQRRTTPAAVLAPGSLGSLACGIAWIVCPKCPACVAGYLALLGLGGITVSLPAAAAMLAGLQGFLIAGMCLGIFYSLWRGYRMRRR